MILHIKRGEFYFAKNTHGNNNNSIEIIGLHKVICITALFYKNLTEN